MCWRSSCAEGGVLKKGGRCGRSYLQRRDEVNIHRSGRRAEDEHRKRQQPLTHAQHLQLDTQAEQRQRGARHEEQLGHQRADDGAHGQGACAWAPVTTRFECAALCKQQPFGVYPAFCSLLQPFAAFGSLLQLAWRLRPSAAFHCSWHGGSGVVPAGWNPEGTYLERVAPRMNTTVGTAP